MKKVKIFFTALAVTMTAAFANAQSPVKGQITDGSTGEAIPFASVQIRGTRTGVSADADGRYEISAPENGVLIFSFLGYATAEIPIGNKGVVNAVLYPDVHLLDEVVVTAMGISRSEKTLGYSATTVKSDELAGSRVSNVAGALAGKVAGVQVQSANSDPGSAQGIIIRGFSSINGENQPLYIVDGIPLQNLSYVQQGHEVSAGGISNISPEDIESMTVLKGAAATALYGSRAANGVIIVTTKQGKRGETRDFAIEYSGNVQLRQIANLPIMQNDFGQGWNGKQTFIENGSWGPAFDGSMQVYGPIWNNQQLIHEFSAVKNNVKDFFELGLSHNHNISFSGASFDNKMTYYASYSYTSDDGIMPSNKDKYVRNTFAFRGSYAPVDWIKVSSSVNFATNKTDIVGSFQGTSVIDGIYEMPRDFSLLDKQDLTSPFNTPEAYGTPYGITNPYWAIANHYFHTDGKQINGKIQADIKPVRQLTISYRYGFDYLDYDRKIGSPQIALDDALITDDMGYAPKNNNEDGTVSTLYRRSYETNHDVIVNFSDKYFDKKFSVDVNLGLNVNERAYTATNGTATGLTVESGFWDLSNGSSWTALGESQGKRRLIGIFGDITLGWDDMVFLNFTARNDWSSTLPKQNNSFFYPGITASWIFSELIPKNNVFSFGKLRLAYGMTGNDADIYQTATTFGKGYSHAIYGSNVALFPMNNTNAFLSSITMGSVNLKPEMTTEIEAGLNLQFFGGRLGLDAAFYNRITSDQIFTLPADPATGYSSMVTNFGKVRNRGIELLLTTTPVQTKNFRWDLDVNFALNRNLVLSMPESLEDGRATINYFSTNGKKDAVYMYAIQGQPMGRFYTYLPTYVEDENSPYYGHMIVDEYGQPVLTKDMVDTGKDMNNKWTGGITTSFTFFGVTLSATLDARIGGYMFSRTKDLMQFTGNGIITTYNSRRPFVIPNTVVDNGDGTYSENSTPICLYDSSLQDYFGDSGFGEGKGFYLMDRSYAKLRNVSLSWNLPKNWMKAIKLRGITIGAYVNNLFTWTPSSNYYVDPETSTDGTDLDGQFGELYANPSCRVWGFNLALKF